MPSHVPADPDEREAREDRIGIGRQRSLDVVHSARQGLPEGTIKADLFAARLKLKTALRERES
jgi:hypothetical protein